MSMLSHRSLFLLGAAALTIAPAGSVLAQQAGSAATALPEIQVTAPSPIRRRVIHPAPASGTGPRVARSTPTPQAPPAPAAPERGTLPIVTDQFATVTVVPNEELRRNPTGSLGDQLFGKPGITGSSFAPGASSRPIIRGLDMNRVGITENGTSANGASDLGEDHFVPVDPLAANQIEVIRGPAALRWGSTSIGGVVNATNNRIPDTWPCGVSPTQAYGYVKAPVATGRSSCTSFETRTEVSSVDSGINGAVLLDAAGNNVAIHADAYGRRASDYSIPAYPYLNEPGLPFDKKQANSAVSSAGGSIGGSYFFDGGFIGAAITQTNALYNIPGVEGSEYWTRIDARQTKFTTKGEYRPDSAVIDAVRFWGAVTDYRHNEIGLEDSSDWASTTIHQTFTNREQEGRVEVQFMPFNARFASITTADGAQIGHQELTAPSPENPGSVFNGLFDPNRNTRVAGYVFNELKFTDTTRAQVAGRVEHVDLSGSTPDFPIDYLPDGTPQFSIARNRSFTPMSASVGLLHDLPWDLVASVSGQYVQRAPKAAELFSRGGHDATGTFDIGNPNLTLETASSVEVGLRRATGPVRFEATGYYTHFNNFIYRRITGVMCDDDFASCGNPDGELQQAVYSQRNATFRGFEFQTQTDVAKLWGGTFGIEAQFDIVRATFEDGSNVPRIPPMRVGGGLFWRDMNWLAKVNLLHAFAQNDVSANETTTPGYNLLRAEVSYTTKLKPYGFGPREITVGAVGNNLLNEQIRNAVSFTKDQVLMPGIGVKLFANLKY